MARAAGSVWNPTALGRRDSVAGSQTRISRTSETVRLLEADPELGSLLTGTRRSDAERDLVVRTHRLSVGPWDVSRLSGASADHVGLLVLDGVLSRELVVADHVSAELLGPGDLVRPWQGASATGLLPVQAVWSVLSTASVSARCAWRPRRRSHSSPASTGA
jgi:hypothetical protein